MTLFKDKIALLLITIALLSTAGCKVGAPYERPELDQPVNFYDNKWQSDAVLLESENMASMGWRAFFRDSTLIALIDTALANNLDMQKMAQNIEVGLLDLEQARVNWLPSLGMDAGLQREYMSENHANYGSNRSRAVHGEDVPTSFYTERLAYYTAFRSKWELDIWGKFKNQKEAALAEYMRREEFRKALQTFLVAEVASAYYNMLMINAQKEVAERNISLNQNTLEIVELQYEAGEVTSLAIRQTESQKLRSEAMIPQLEKAYYIQENRLNRLLGKFPEPIEITQTLNILEEQHEYNTGVPLELLKNRPDIAASEYSLIAANAQAGIAEAMRYPSLTIDAGLGMDSYQLNRLFDPVSSGFAFFNGALFQPIFQNKKLKTNHKKALIVRDIAQLDFKEKLLIAINEVSDALVTAERLKEEHRIAQRRMEVAVQGVEDASLLFRSGFANYLEVITAQEDALGSELEVINIEMHILLANIELYRSLGGGWR